MPAKNWLMSVTRSMFSMRSASRARRSASSGATPAAKQASVFSLSAAAVGGSSGFHGNFSVVRESVPCFVVVMLTDAGARELVSF